MKYLWVYLIFAALNFVNAQSNCEATEQFALAYQHQVEVMALDAMLDSGTSDTNLIRIPDSYFLPIMQALAGVYNSGIPEADSVFNFFCLNNKHADELLHYRSKAINVSLDTNFAWTESWLNEQVPSGHPVIDSLLSGLVYEADAFQILPLVTLEFDEVINLPAVVRALEEVEGVNYAERTTFIGFTGNVRHEKFGLDHFFVFQEGWGDCLSGCIHKRQWEFWVLNPGCGIELANVYGSGYIPEDFAGQDCGLSTGSLNPPAAHLFEIYPNPVFDKLNIRSEEIIQSISIYNSVGQKVLRKSVSDQSVEIDAGILPQGLYFIRTNQGSVRSFFKL